MKTKRTKREETYTQADLEAAMERINPDDPAIDDPMMLAMEYAERIANARRVNERIAALENDKDDLEREISAMKADRNSAWSDNARLVKLAREKEAQAALVPELVAMLERTANLLELRIPKAGATYSRAAVNESRALIARVKG